MTATRGAFHDRADGTILAVARLTIRPVLAVTGALALTAVVVGAPPGVPELPDLATTEPQVKAEIRRAHRALRDEPESAERWGHYASVLAVHEYLAEAVPAFETASRLDPQAFRWPYLLAVKLSGDDPQRSLELLERAAALRDDYVPLHLRRAGLLERAGRPQDAEAAYRRALALDPANRHAHAGLGRRLTASGASEPARHHLERALADGPLRAALAGLAQWHRRWGDLEMAERLARRAAALPLFEPPDLLAAELERLGVSTTAVMRRVLALERAGRLRDARAILERLVRDHPATAPGRSRLGEVHLAEGNPAAALAQFRAALNLAPDLVVARIGLGLALARSGRLPEAQKTFERLLEIHPASVRAHTGLAATLAEMGRLDGAAASFRRAVELAPENVMARLGYGKTLYYLGEPEQAHPILMAVAEPHGGAETAQVVDALGHAGLALLRLKRSDEAAGALARAVDAAPARSDLRQILALALVESARDGDAAAVLEDGLRRAPGDGTLALMLARLLATSPVDEVRNGTRALDLAGALARVTQERDPEVLGVLACAYAETGRFAEAFEATVKAAALARRSGRDDLLQRLSDLRLAFEAGRPYRESR